MKICFTAESTKKRKKAFVHLKQSSIFGRPNYWYANYSYLYISNNLIIKYLFRACVESGYITMI